MTRYQRDKRLHTWISAGIAMSVYLLVIFLGAVAGWITS